mgnify:CR=1 FL=1|jgi:hypothetical protein
MADKNKLKDLLKQRTTLPQREAIEPVNLYKVKEKTEKPNERTERGNDTSERLDRTVKLQTSVLEEIKEGIKDDKRPTERYSFEIYTDQKQEIEDLQYRYKKKTGNKLSASRIIREALEVYLKQAISTLKG